MAKYLDSKETPKRVSFLFDTFYLMDNLYRFDKSKL
jgi:hypothetical protein